MKHSVEELLEIIYYYYPRDVRLGDPRHHSTEESRRRIKARHGAIPEYQRWLALLGRLRARFATCSVEDLALYHPKGDFDASFSAKLVLPTIPPHVGQHALYFMRSFLAPYYTVVNSTSRYMKREGGGYTIAEDEQYTFSVEEEPYALAIADEIEVTFGGELMLPEVGEVVVLDIDIRRRGIRRSTIFDCLFTAYRG